MGIPLKVVLNARHLQKNGPQHGAAIIFGPSGSWKLLFGDCVAQGSCLKLSEAIFDFSIFSPNFFPVFENPTSEKPEISPKHYYGKPYSNHRVLGGFWVRICKKWRHLEPLRRSGGALGGARAPVTQKTIALSIPVTQRAVENVSGRFAASQGPKTRKSSQKANFRFFGLLDNPGYHCRYPVRCSTPRNRSCTWLARFPGRVRCRLNASLHPGYIE